MITSDSIFKNAKDNAALKIVKAQEKPFLAAMPTGAKIDKPSALLQKYIDTGNPVFKDAAGSSLTGLQSGTMNSNSLTNESITSTEEILPSSYIPKMQKTGDKDFDEYKNSVAKDFGKERKNILKLFQSNDPHVVDVRLGGSFGRGTPRKDSDIDIEILYNGSKDPEKMMKEELTNNGFPFGHGHMADIQITNNPKKFYEDLFQSKKKRYKKTK